MLSSYYHLFNINDIDTKIVTLETQTGVQLGKVIVDTTMPLTVEEYANEVFNVWRLGRLNIDDGILLVVALEDRAVRIKVGYGLKGQITDLFASHVINDYILPNFKAERYGEGIALDADALITKVK